MKNHLLLLRVRPAQPFQAQEQDFGPVPPPRRKQPAQPPQPASEMEPETAQPQRHQRETAPELPGVKTGHKTADRDFDRFSREDRDEEFEDEKPKRSLMPVIIGIIVLVIVGAGIIVGYFSFIKKPEKQVTLQTPVTPARASQTMPELSQPAQTPAAAAPAPEVTAPPHGAESRRTGRATGCETGRPQTDAVQIEVRFETSSFIGKTFHCFKTFGRFDYC